jgi:hypothetical protein
MRTKFYLWLCKWSFRKIARPLDKAPMGLPYMRDPENICDSYMPLSRKMFKWGGGCETDGHYLCDGCALNKKYDK